MHLLLLRHGQTDDNARGVLQGQSPTELNALGHTQARELASRLTTFAPRVEALVTSDLTRAVQTAAAIERALGLTARRAGAWRERGFGPYEGRAVGEAETWRLATGNWDLPGAEPTSAFRARVLGAFDEVVAGHASVSCVAVVTHGAVIRTVLTLIGEGVIAPAPGQPTPESVPIANCSILWLQAEGTEARRAWRVACVNDVAHLETRAASAPLAGQ